MQSTIRFNVTPMAEPIHGELSYRADELSWDFSRRESGSGTWSLEWGTLQIEVDDEGRLLFLWGYHPWQSWLVDGALRPPSFTPARVDVDAGAVIPGTSLRLCSVDDLLTVADPANDTVRVGRRDLPRGEQAFEIADNTGLELDAEGSIAALWLRAADLPRP